MCLSERFFTAFAATQNCSFFDLNDCQKLSQLLVQSATAFFNLVIVAILLTNTRTPLKFYRVESVQDLVSFISLDFLLFRLS